MYKDDLSDLRCCLVYFQGDEISGGLVISSFLDFLIFSVTTKDFSTKFTKKDVHVYAFMGYIYGK